MQALGFAGGQVLEPGCGSGNFLGFAPPGADLTGVELDPVTAAIAAALYPQARVLTGSFADTRDQDGSYDLVIGNVPFGQAVLHDRVHNTGGHSIHNHFIIKSLHLTRPGGLVAVLTSRYTMDARNPAARREIAALADLAGAVRLPGGAHQRAAGTGVVTDLLILRRREPGRQPDASRWEQARPVTLAGRDVLVSEYFADCPAMVLGEMSAAHGAYSADDLTVTAAPGVPLADALGAALDSVAASARARSLTWSPAPAGPQPPPSPVSAHADGHLEAHPDGTFTKVTGGRAEPVAVPRTQAAELRALLGLRDTAAALLDAEAANPQDTPETKRLRDELARRYDSYVLAHGPLNRFALRRTGRADPGHRPGPDGPRPRGPGRVPRRPARAAGLRAGGVRPGRPARREGRDLHPAGHRAPDPAAGRRLPGGRAGDLPGRLRRGPAGRDRPPAGHRPGRGSAGPGHAGVQRPRRPGGCCPPRSTCPATCAPGCAPPRQPPGTTPGSP